MRCACCTLRLLTGLGAAGWVLPPVVRRGEGTRSFRQTFCLNGGNPTQEGEQVGVAFLLVTFLWPRKEKSLAQARRAGETLSRTESSRPAWRSHVNPAVYDIE